MIGQFEWARALVTLVGVSTVTLVLLACVIGAAAIAFRRAGRRGSRRVVPRT